MIDAEPWNYFHEDTAYAKVLADRLRDGVEMDSAIGLASALRDQASGDLAILDFGSGPGHYQPVLHRIYDCGAITYRGIDIVPASIAIGNAYFADDANVSLAVGSVLEPAASYRGENCIISANTLPHVPTIAPLLGFIRDTPEIEIFAFRMLIGQECVGIRKHLSNTEFDGLFETAFQFNNIYSAAYIDHMLGGGWTLQVLDDHVNPERLRQHAVPFQREEPFYGNRVSRSEGGLSFKGDVYMPWKLVVGTRID